LNDDKLWRARFLTFTLVRVAGLALFVAGIAIAFTDLLRPGGWPLVGGLLTIVGALDAVLAPRILRRTWERQDSGQ
jgi:membrane protein implicated in regulation of membrane protease activity